MNRFFKQILFVSLLGFAGQACAVGSKPSTNKYSFLSKAYNQLSSRFSMSYKLLAGAGAALGFSYVLYRLHLWSKPQTVVELMKAFNGYEDEDNKQRVDGAIQKDIKLIAECIANPEKVKTVLAQKSKQQLHCAVGVVDISQVDQLSGTNKQLVSYYQQDSESQFWNLIRSILPEGSYEKQLYGLSQSQAQIMGILEAQTYINALKKESPDEYAQFVEMTPELKAKIVKGFKAMDLFLTQHRAHLFGPSRVQVQEQNLAAPDFTWCPAKISQAIQESLDKYKKLAAVPQKMVIQLGMMHGRILGLMQAAMQEYGFEIEISDGEQEAPSKKAEKQKEETETPQWQEAKKNWYWYALAIATPLIFKTIVAKIG